MAELRVIDAIPPGKDLSDYLEHVTEKVANGEVSAMAVALVYRDGPTGSGYSHLSNTATMVGSLEALKSKLIRDMLDD